MTVNNAVLEISEHDELLALLLEDEGISAPSDKVVARVGSERQLRPSFAQARLWFVEQMEPGRSTYNIPFVVRLSGVLDRDALQRSVNEVMRRHESLRTTFVAAEEGAAMVIAPAQSLVLSEIDLSSLPEIEREAEALKLATEETQRPFDLARGPLMRACLLRLTPTDCIFVTTIHHIISDGWSMGILYRELSLLYDAYSSRKESLLEEPVIQYSDYAAWQRDWLMNGELERQLSYWKRQLQDAPPKLALPVDHQRSAGESSHGTSLTFELPAAIRDELNGLSLRENSTLFMTLLAAFNVLLYRYSRQEDICVGSLVAGRVRPEIEDVIGLFTNTVVMRTDLSRNPTFLELLRRVRELTFEALAHQDLPFDKLVEEIHPERDLNSTALFQAMFILQNAHSEKLNLARLEEKEITIPRVTAMFALTLEMAETATGLSGTLTYRSDLFEAATIERLISHFKTLVKSIVADPDQRISTLPLLSEIERRQVVEEFNQTECTYPHQLCLHQLFEAQVVRTPAAVALVFGDEQVSYAELNARANHLAHYLRRQGVGPEVLVGVCLERGVEMVVALLAILKAGGAYLPLDPGYPRERIEFMLADAEVSLLLMKAVESAGVPPAGLRPDSGEFRQAASGPKVICLDTEAAAIAAESAADLANETAARNLAFVIYTSGSTGQPKGVQITQSSAQAFIAWALANCKRSHLDYVLASTSICFDLSIYELFVPLSSGGAVVLVENALQLAQLGDTVEITLINTVPSAIAELLRMDAVRSSVRRVNLAGEPLPKSLVDQLYKLKELEEVWNLYGPSEDTTYSTAALQPRALERSVAIGKPISNTEVYLLDGSLEPVPLGVAGELYLGGAGLARGYLKRPELTATRFIPHPFTTRHGARLYRTGDLARFRVDGNIEFLGRVDQQVKLRGYRIELGEIETVLSGHEQVSEVVVLAESGQSGAERLVGYVARQPGAEVTTAELREYLKGKLPAYMVPGTFVLLEQLPLTANGKINRRALAAMDTGQQESEEYVGPRTPEEEMLAGTWREILGVDLVGVHDNFFAIGGHSLLATRLVVRVRNVFGKELTVRQVFEAPTIAGQARLLCDQHRTERTTVMERTERGPDCLPLSYAQERLWVLEQLEPGSSAYNIPVAFRLTGPLDEAALRWSLNEIVKRHEVLRTTFVTIDGRPEQAIASSLTLTLPVVRLEQPTAAEREAEAGRLIEEESRYSFDLTCGPLLRAALLELGEQDHVLVLNMHHIVSDGWSIGILLRELTSSYKAFVQGDTVLLPELSIQYADFAVWQRRWLEGNVLEAQLSYWKRQLKGALPVLELPSDKQRPPVQTHEGERQVLLLSEDLTDALKALSQCEGVTEFMTLLAVFKIFLHRLTGQDDIIVGSPIAGRNRAEIENLIGFFVNTLVLRTDLSGNPAFRELLGRVRETALGAYSNQDVPFEHLLEALQPERNVSRTPLFQVFFNLLNFEGNAIELLGLTTAELPETNVQAKFDLTLYVEEEAGRFKFAFVYNTSLFSHERVAEMVEQLRQLLSDVVAHPEESIGALSLITPTAHKLLPNPASQLRPTWSGAAHTQFSERARSFPHHPAVVDRNETYSYQELDARSNQLAQYLLAHGVEPQDIVAIYAHRSASLVLALLGIVKAGAAFVVLDPTYPPARLLAYLEATRPKGWIRIREAGTPHATLQANAKTFSFDLDLCGRSEANGHDVLSDYSTAGTGIAIQPDNMAYVSFTSGSTGKPKAIVGKHGSVAHFAPWASRMFGIGRADRFTVFSGLSHDPLHRDVFVPLQLGATICIPDPEDMSVPARLAGWMDTQKITVSNVTPAMGQLIGQAVAEQEGLQLPALRLLFFVGDLLTRRDAARLRMLAPATDIINLYGTTETSRAVSYYIVPRPEAAYDAEKSRNLNLEKEIVPLGRGISEVQLLVRNAAGKQAGVGELGEIYFRSPHLAKGYLGDEQLTREKFLRNPFTHDPDDLLYRTGDLGRYLPDGNVESLGRADTQVQIRGFRIELGEIEAHLGQHDAVRESAVIVREEIPGEKRLVAYIVPAHGQAPSVSELRLYLKNALPDYMVPSSFVMLDELPLTPNGKLDRKALPKLVQARSETTDGLPESRSPVEEMLAEMWADLIGIESVGVNDNFFELGGHSLLATQLMFRVRKAFRVEVPLFELFKEPTIASLASIIETLREKVNKLTPPTDMSLARTLLSYSQQRLWFLDTLEPGTAAHNEAVAVRVEGPLDVAVLQKSIDEVVHRHDVLHATFLSEEGQAVQAIAEPVSLVLTLHDLTLIPPSLQEAEAKRVIVEAAKRPFDLSRGPLVRTILVRLNEREHILGLVTHNIVCDADSLVLFVRELTTLYQAFQQGQPSPLPELSIQYAGFAKAQQEWVKAEGLTTQLPYWEQQLAVVRTVPELITDRPRPAVRTFSSGRQVLNTPARLLDELRSLSDPTFVTILAALKVLLHHYTGSDIIVVGTEVSGRDDAESESLIGPFANQLALCTNLAGDPTFKELLARVRETVAGAYAHQRLPFEEVVEALKPARDRARTPLFQVRLVSGKSIVDERELGELKVAPVEVETGTTLFDMTIFVEESPSGLTLIVEYNSDLFESSRIASIARCLEVLLMRVVREPETRLSELSNVLSEAQRQEQDEKQTDLKTNVTQKLRNLKRRTA